MSYRTQSSPGTFDAPGHIRRARRVADLSQVELADRLGVARSSVARWESGEKVPSLERLLQILAIAGLGLVAVGEDGVRVPPMRTEAVRDLGNRRFPAHLDVRPAEPDMSIVGDTERLGTAWHRGRRDQGRGSGAAAEDRARDDHPTEADVHAKRQEVRRQRRDQVRKLRQAAEDARRARGIPPMVCHCFCVDSCYLDDFCASDCPCQCDAAPGREWGERCPLPRRSNRPSAVAWAMVDPTALVPSPYS